MEEKTVLKIQTKYFGEIDCYPENMLCFPRGLFGFEEEQRFVLLPFEGDGGLYSLQSIATPGLAFVAVEPDTLYPGYAPRLQDEDLALLEADENSELFYYALCAVKEPVAVSTVNLRCPVVIHEKNMRAIQVILEDGQYGMRHLLCDITRQEGMSC